MTMVRVPGSLPVLRGASESPLTGSLRLPVALGLPVAVAAAWATGSGATLIRPSPCAARGCRPEQARRRSQLFTPSQWPGARLRLPLRQQTRKRPGPGPRSEATGVQCHALAGRHDAANWKHETAPQRPRNDILVIGVIRQPQPPEPASQPASACTRATDAVTSRHRDGGTVTPTFLSTVLARDE
jgi:hypothetical protein